MSSRYRGCRSRYFSESRAPSSAERPAPPGAPGSRGRKEGDAVVPRTGVARFTVELRFEAEAQPRQRRSRRPGDEGLPGVLRAALRLLARRRDARADEREAPRSGVRL